jgi:hypothetical protein
VLVAAEAAGAAEAWAEAKAAVEEAKAASEALRAVKAWAAEYESIGQIFGTYGGRWVFIPDNKHMAWPEGTAVYVRRRQA